MKRSEKKTLVEAIVTIMNQNENHKKYKMVESAKNNKTNIGIMVDTGNATMRPIVNVDENLTHGLCLTNMSETAAAFKERIGAMLEDAKEQEDSINGITNWIYDYNKVKKRLSLKVISRKNNRWSDECPSIAITSDLIAIARVNVNDMAAFTVRYTNMKMWNVDKDTLLSDAKENDLALFPTKSRTMAEMTLEMLGLNAAGIPLPDDPIRVMTKKGYSEGASVLAHPEKIQEVIDKTGYKIISSDISEESKKKFSFFK